MEVFADELRAGMGEAVRKMPAVSRAGDGVRAEACHERLRICGAPPPPRHRGMP